MLKQNQYTISYDANGVSITEVGILFGEGATIKSFDSKATSKKRGNSQDHYTAMPYDGIEAMDPEAILAFYNEMGFSDWTQESTGTGLLKAQHPELETFLGEGSFHAATMRTLCSGCTRA